MTVRDVAIVGGGPAGTSLAAACARRGLDVEVIAAPGSHRWGATYGTWLDDLDPCDGADDLRRCLRVTWPSVRVVGTRERVLPRAYGLFDNDRLASHLAHPSVASREAVATGVQRALGDDGEHLVVQCSGSAAVSARLVVDAAGSDSPLLARHRRKAPGVQSAFGVFRPIGDTPQVAPGTFTLMDWSDPLPRARPSTFLYAMDLGDGRAFVEETSLVAPRPMPAVELRRRLAARLGVEVPESAAEDVRIAMGGRLPARSSTVVGFGAAAGYVHPVTGYSVAASLRAAPRVASAIAAGIADGARGGQLSARAWHAVWSRDAIRTRVLHDHGLAVLTRLSGDDLRAFFDRFFDLPVESWSAYLRIDASSRDVAGAMTRLFLSLPSNLRLRVALTPPTALVGLLRV